MRAFPSGLMIAGECAAVMATWEEDGGRRARRGAFHDEMTGEGFFLKSSVLEEKRG
jgi:hypothetical protein